MGWKGLEVTLRVLDEPKMDLRPGKAGRDFVEEACATQAPSIAPTQHIPAAPRGILPCARQPLPRLWSSGPGVQGPQCSEGILGSAGGITKVMDEADVKDHAERPQRYVSGKTQAPIWFKRGEKKINFHF